MSVTIVRGSKIIEVYRYEKDYVSAKKRPIRKKRSDKKPSNSGTPLKRYRSKRSISRARKSFFRLVEANIEKVEDVTLSTFTCHDQYTSLEVGYKALGEFFRLYKSITGVRTRWIAVPEWQKRGALHYHVIIWGISSIHIEREKETRNLQRLWNRGFADFTPAYGESAGIAGYMAKYLVKALEDERLFGRRAYSSSRSLHRPSTYRFNEADEDFSVMFIPKNKTLQYSKTYDTQYRGECQYDIYKVEGTDELPDISIISELII